MIRDLFVYYCVILFIPIQLSCMFAVRILDKNFGQEFCQTSVSCLVSGVTQQNYICDENQNFISN